MELVQLAMLLIPMFVLMGFGVPIFLAMGITCLLFVLLFDLPMMILAQSYVRGLYSYDFLALPFYFLAGDLMNHGGITRRLVSFSQALIGHVRGGLSHVNIIASMIFSGVSGSAVADTSAIGSVLIPSMKKSGYPGPYAAAVTAASSTIGPIIPPSIPLVVYGLIGQVSVGKLFLGGAIPGVMMGVYLLITSFAISRRRGYPAIQWAGLKKLLRSGLDAGLALIMPFIIVGGITSGVVTPTEAGVIAVVYALLLGCFVYREIGLQDLPRILGNTMVNSGTVLIIIASSGLFSWIIANMKLGEVLVGFFLSISTNKWVILGILNIFFLLWGCVLDPVTAMIILLPIFIPLVQELGIDLVHFGVVVVINLMIGLVTPPVGILTYLSASIAEARLENVMKESIPFLLALLIVLIMCTYWPALVMWLPELLMK
ncbi:MAG: C4-dicarboxylate ABC transporter permease [Acidiferrobacteraceae bacterium]|nr:C4-dicarboxylate ABC transporter permease [Acidiferrobacteraceae bacterium]